MAKKQAQQKKTRDLTEAEIRRLVSRLVRDTLGSLLEEHQTECDWMVALIEDKAYSNEKDTGAIRHTGEPVECGCGCVEPKGA